MPERITDLRLVPCQLHTPDPVTAKVWRRTFPRTTWENLGPEVVLLGDSGTFWRLGPSQRPQVTGGTVGPWSLLLPVCLLSSPSSQGDGFLPPHPLAMMCCLSRGPEYWGTQSLAGTFKSTGPGNLLSIS